MQQPEREQCFVELYERTHAQLAGYALRRVPSPEDAADLVAETYLIAWRRLEDVPEGAAAILWLYATARRLLANQYRRELHHQEVMNTVRRELAAALAGQMEAANEDAFVARTALMRLSEDDQELLMLAGWEGLGSAELARVLGCSATAARIRLYRARSRLSAEMAGLGISDPWLATEKRHHIGLPREI